MHSISHIQLYHFQCIIDKFQLCAHLVCEYRVCFLEYGVMVALQILILSDLVRVRVLQRNIVTVFVCFYVNNSSVSQKTCWREIERSILALVKVPRKGNFMSNNLNSFQGKHVQGFCSSADLFATIDGKKYPVSIQFNRLYQVHDVCPRSIELPTRTVHLFDDLHGRPKDSITEYLMYI